MQLQEENTQLEDLRDIENDNFYVLEEQIDIDLQTEYFQMSRKLKDSGESRKAMRDFALIHDENLTLNAKKHILVALASVEKVEAFRLLESYHNHPKEELRDWATLAFNESRMLMESSLSNERQVFISTGMGGKGEHLRYFMVLFPSDPKGFDEFQKKFIVDEVKFTFEFAKEEVESVAKISDRYIAFTVMVSLKRPIEKLMKETFESCNQFGNFLDSKFIITNVKAMEEDEILNFLMEDDSYQELDADIKF